MRRIFGVAVAALLGVVTAGNPGIAADAPPVAGFDVVSTTPLAPGLTHTVLRRTDPPQVVHVARLAANSRLRLRAVLSNDAVGGPGGRLERTSAMCARVSCVAAVNGDFAGIGTDEPVGAMVIDSEMVRTPVPSHHQVVIGQGSLAAGALETTTQIVPTDLRTLVANGVNRPRGDGQLLLYTPAHGPSTGTNAHGAELLLEVDGGRILTNHTVMARMKGVVDGGNSAVPRGGAVLSGHGDAAAALRDLWQRAQAGAVSPELMIRVDTSIPAETAVGGTPVLVREGRRWVAASGDRFVTGRHPRTAVGWTKERDVLLVTADGRQPHHSLGMTLPETADLLVALGAIEALNLDGGGSTTFVAGSRIVNSPSDRVVVRNGKELVVHTADAGDRVLGAAERPVVSAIAIVDDERGADDITPRPPQLPGRTVRYFAAADPASIPDSSLASLLPHREDGRVPPVLVATAALLLVLTGAGAAASRRPALPLRSLD